MRTAIDKLSRALPDRLPMVAGIVVLAIYAVRVVWFAALPDDIAITVVPDDAFYYLKLADNRIALGRWTFDGVAPTTGFHLAWGYGLTALRWLAPSLTWKGTALLVACGSALLVAGCACWLARFVESVFGGQGVPFAVAGFLGMTGLTIPTSLMETPLVIVASVLTITYALPVALPRPRTAPLLFLIGVFGSLARTDYGLLPGMLVVVVIASHLAGRRLPVWPSLVTLAGAIFGIGLGMLHTYAIAGHFFQASAEMKLQWSQAVGPTLLPALSFVLSICSPLLGGFPLAYAGIPLAIVLAIATLVKMWPATHDAAAVRKWAATLACLLTLLGYAAVYQFNGSIQPWYIANLVVPAGVATAAVACGLAPRLTRALIVVVVLGTCLPLAVFIKMPYWPAQAGMRSAALSVRDELPSGTYASWNAGIISYLSGRPVINLDGLVNDDVVPYARSGQLLDYLRIRSVDYVVDYERMLSPAMRRQGGYDDPQLAACLVPVKPLDADGPAWQDSRLMLYRVSGPCRA